MTRRRLRHNAVMGALLTVPRFAALLAAAILTTLARGPDNLAVLRFGMTRGRKPGVAFGLGCARG